MANTTHWHAKVHITLCVYIYILRVICFFHPPKFIYFVRRWLGEGQKHRESERIPSRLPTARAELEPKNCEITTWAEIKSLNRLPYWATQATLLFFNVLFIFERDKAWAGEGERRERGGGRGSEVGSALRAAGPTVGLKLTNCEIVTWAKGSRSTDWATQAPRGLCTS